MEHRAALFAAKGFTTLALAYFGYKDLPSMIDEEHPLELEYFLEAMKWLGDQPSVAPGGLGVIGTSFGAILCVMI